MNPLALEPASPPTRTPPLDTPIQYVKGVGPRRAELFAAAGVHTLADLLEYFPIRYEERSGEVEIADLRPGMIATIRGEIIRARHKPPMRALQIADASGICTLRWFNEPLPGQRIGVGAEVLAMGEVREYNNTLEIVQPRIEFLSPVPGDPRQTIVGSDRLERVTVGVYPAKGRLQSNAVRDVLSNVLKLGKPAIPDILPPAVLAKRGYPTRAEAIVAMHRPDSRKDLERARKRLAYEEFFLMELAMALRRRARVALLRGESLPVTAEIDKRIRARFPFTLTESQNTVLREIARDLAGGTPMTRLLQGDVGSGKTVVALYAALVAIANKAQAAIMAPTEILAHQHFRNIEKYLAGSRVRCLFLSGDATRKERAENLAAIERGAIDLVVGTHALIQKDVGFKRLGLVVVDEQHKFGVLQRHEFRTKGNSPHYLVMTATPIPRTLAMTVFGDLDVSIIRHSPRGRGGIITKVVPAAKWAIVMRYVRERLEKGEQAYVVCPLINPQKVRDDADAMERAISGDESIDKKTASRELTSVTEEFERLSKGPWKDLPIGLLHGGMRSDAKTKALQQFSAGALKALIATTVVEVGVDVPNATIMIVEHADRFGLSQLHQLRGRIGRGSKESLCVLIAHQAGAKSLERLDVMVKTTDGFRIAEADLQQRGPGALFGTRQHGLPDLKFGNIVEDFGIVEQAREDAFEIVNADPMLRRPEHAQLVPALRSTYGEHLKLIDAG